MTKISNFTFAFVILFFLQLTAFGQWTNLNANISGNLYAVKIKSTNVNYFMVAGESGIHRSLDGGISWNRILPNTADSVTYNLTTFKEIRQVGNEWVVVGKHRVSNLGVVFFSGGSGTTWTMGGLCPYGINNVNGTLLGWETYCDGGFKCVTGNQGATWTSTWTGIRFPLQNRSSSGYYVATDSAVFRELSSFVVDLNSSAKDVEIFASRVVAVDSEAVYIKNGAWTQTTSYNGPLVGRCVEPINYSLGLIGSENGVFLGRGNFEIWEHQPSSQGYAVNNIFVLQPSLWALAVCDNGQVIINFNAHDEGIPYLKVSSPNGACAGFPTTFTNESVSTHTYQWSINGVLTATTYHLNHTFATPGTYSIQLIGTNGSLVDTLTTSFIVVPAPTNNYAYSIDDTLHCKSGVSTISIPNSLSAFRYELVDISTGLVANSTIGNGATIQVNTGMIVDTTAYSLRMASITTSCTSTHLDTIMVYVENTKARFASGLINAAKDEAFDYYNLSESALNYEWNFGNGASLPNAFTATPPTISYNAIGDPMVRLVAISASGCRDTLDTLPVFVYDPTRLHEKIWGLAFDGLNGASFVSGDFAVDTVTGSIYGLQFNFSGGALPSKYGRTGPTSNSAGFVTKYDSLGVLKWSLPLSLSNYNTHYGPPIAVGPDGEIIFSSKKAGFGINSKIQFIDHSIDSTTGQFGGIYKITATGLPKWKQLYIGSDLPAIQIDKRNNVYLIGRQTSFFQSPTVLYSTAPNSGPQLTTKMISISKFSPSGAHLFEVNGYCSSSIYDSRAYIDNAGGIWLTSPQIMYFRDRNGTFSSMPHNSNFNLQNQAVGLLARADSSGFYQWTRSYQYSPVYTTLTIRNGLFQSFTQAEGGKMYFQARLFPFFWWGSAQRNFYVETGSGLDTLDFPGHIFGQYDTLGTLQWLQQEPNPTTSQCHIGETMAVDRQGNLVLGHNPEDTLMVMSQNQTVDTIVGRHKFVLTKYDHNGVLLDYTIQKLLDPTHYNGTNIFVFGIEEIGRIMMSHDDKPIVYGRRPNTMADTLIYFGAGETFNVIDTGAQIITKLDWDNCDSAEIQVIAPSCTIDSVTLQFTVNPNFPIYPGNEYRIYGMVHDGYFRAGQPLATISSTQRSHTITLAVPLISTMWFEVESSEPPLQGVSGRVLFQTQNAPLNVNMDLCDQDSIVLYSSPGTSHNWSPAAWVSQNGIQAPVVSTSTSGLLTCMVDGFCQPVIDSFYVNVQQSPTLNVAGDSTICEGDTIQIFANTNGSVTWTPNYRISNINSQSPLLSPWITTTYTATAQSLGNTCIQRDSVAITVLNLPGQISQNGNTLITNPGFTYQWLLNGQPIPGANQATYLALATGNYSVIQYGLGCQKETAPIYILITDLEESTTLTGMQVFPNPTEGKLNVVLDLPQLMPYSIHLIDMFGRDLGILIDQPAPLNDHLMMQIDLSSFGCSKGVYFLEARIGVEKIRRTVVYQ